MRWVAERFNVFRVEKREKMKSSVVASGVPRFGMSPEVGGRL